MNEAEEQAEISVSKIGKFNNAEDLLSAYNALESEFTKRCQLIKQLQTELDALRAQADSINQSEKSFADEQPPAQAQIDSSPDTANEHAKNTDGITCRRHAEESETDCIENMVVAAQTADSGRVLDEVLRCAHEYAEALSAIPEIMDACIFKYKQRLMDARGSAVSPSGMAVIVPAKRPRSLADAKRLADEMLK